MDEKFKDRIRIAFKKGGEIAGIAVHLTANTTPLGKAAALIGVAQTLLDEESLESRYDQLPRLQIARGLQEAILAALAPALHRGDQRGKEQVFELRTQAATVVWVMHSENSSPSGPWVIDGTENDALDAIGRALWERLGSAVSIEVSKWGERVTMVSDDLTKCLTSKLSTELANRTKLYNAIGESRSVLLHGPPGTGKSYIMRDAAIQLGGFSLRHQVSWGSETVLCDAVRILCPRTILLDDLDRASTSSLLDAVERIKNTVRAVFVSANYVEKLDPALRRPGRFDETILVERLDEEAFLAITDGAPPKDAEKLRNLPAAYINEYMVTMKALGEDAASDRLKGLIALEESIRLARAPATAATAATAEAPTE